MKGLARAGLVVAAAYIATVSWKIVAQAKEKEIDEVDYILVLGAKVNEKGPSLALQERIKTAASLALKHKEATIVCSGGQGSDEPIAEAEAIRNGLIAEGIAAGRLVVEGCSTSTRENVAFSKRQLKDPSARGVIVTNSFHLYRASSLAQDYGLDVVGMPASTPREIRSIAWIREYAAIAYYYLQKSLPCLRKTSES